MAILGKCITPWAHVAPSYTPSTVLACDAEASTFPGIIAHTTCFRSGPILSLLATAQVYIKMCKNERVTDVCRQGFNKICIKLRQAFGHQPYILSHCNSHMYMYMYMYILEYILPSLSKHNTGMMS